MSALIPASVLGPIEELIESALTEIHDIGATWAWSIIILTLIVRLILLPLTLKSAKSMQRLQQFQPEIKKLQEKHKGDRQKLQAETMSFYKENSINPFGSCLPVLLQLPVFFSLFFVLRNFSSNPPGGQAAVDAGEFSFMFGWIENITVHTSAAGFAGFILIVLYVLSQLGSTLLMPSTMDKLQRRLFLAMPFLFVPFVINFPVGLMLYWITTNVWTCGQQYAIRKLMPPPPAMVALREQQQNEKEAEKAAQKAAKERAEAKAAKAANKTAAPPSRVAKDAGTKTPQPQQQPGGGSKRTSRSARAAKRPHGR